MSNKDTVDFHGNVEPDDVLYDSQVHTFTNFPRSAVDDEEEDEDKSKLITDQKKAPSFWKFEYYQQFFDVETRQVLHRIASSMLPLPNKNYMQTTIRSNPDLYGPFWICTTLVFMTTIAGNLTSYLSSQGKDFHWRYDFHKVTFAAAAIFTYWWMVPGLVYTWLWYRKCQAEYSFTEILCIYGYSMFIYIPISILWVINLVWLKWLLVVLGAVLSGGVILLTVWPMVKEDSKKVSTIFLAILFVFHLALAAGFVLFFFNVPSFVSPNVDLVTSSTQPSVFNTSVKAVIKSTSPPD